MGMTLGKSLRLRRIFAKWPGADRGLRPAGRRLPGTVRLLARAGADAVVLTPGRLDVVAEELAGLSVILRIDGGPGPAQQLLSVQAALEMGAEALLVGVEALGPDPVPLWSASAASPRTPGAWHAGDRRGLRGGVARDRPARHGIWRRRHPGPLHSRRPPRTPFRARHWPAVPGQPGRGIERRSGLLDTIYDLMQGKAQGVVLRDRALAAPPMLRAIHGLVHQGISAEEAWRSPVPRSTLPRTVECLAYSSRFCSRLSRIWAANFRLYLADGSFHLVREYQVEGDRVRFYSVERSEWEEVPLRLADLKRTVAEREAHQETLRKDAAELAAEEKFEREQSPGGRAGYPGARRSTVGGQELKTVPLELLFRREFGGIFAKRLLVGLTLGHGALEVREAERDLLPLAALDTVKSARDRLHLVFPHQVEGAVRQVQPEVGGPERDSREQKRDEYARHSTVLGACSGARAISRASSAEMPWCTRPWIARSMGGAASARSRSTTPWAFALHQVVDRVQETGSGARSLAQAGQNGRPVTRTKWRSAAPSGMQRPG